MRFTSRLTSRVPEAMIPTPDGTIIPSSEQHEKPEACDTPELQDALGEQLLLEVEIESKFGKFCVSLAGLTY